MFNADFFPTPEDVVFKMIDGLDLDQKNVLEPSAGKGNIVDELLTRGASVIACESNVDLQKILATKCKILAPDFLTVTSDQVSHIKFIIMNPPFSDDERHISHAWEIAPSGCHIVALCNSSTITNPYSAARKRLKSTVDEYGTVFDLGNCFSNAERKTDVNVSLIRLQKPGSDYNTEFDGFFMEEDPEEAQAFGIMEYNVVRDLVNRYVAAIKIYDQQLDAGVKMNSVLSGYYGEQIGFQITEKGAPKARSEFKKDLQRAGWTWIFAKMNMKKYATRGLKEDINKFVEERTEMPFTMRNIYHMLEIVTATHGQRMDKAILEVFDHVTKFSDDNKYGLPGFKTNSHFLLTKRFIVPDMTYQDKYDKEYHPNEIRSFRWHTETIDDMVKALCYVTGEDYDNYESLSWLRDKPYGEWFDWGFFKVKAFKKGTVHFEFISEDIWGKFNQRVAKIKGYPLYEGKTQTAYQNRQTGRPQPPKTTAPATVLFSTKVA